MAFEILRGMHQCIVVAPACNTLEAGHVHLNSDLVHRYGIEAVCVVSGALLDE